MHVQKEEVDEYLKLMHQQTNDNNNLEILWGVKNEKKEKTNDWQTIMDFYYHSCKKTVFVTLFLI